MPLITSPLSRLVDFMAALSDPGGFSKGAEKQAETMKGLGIEQTDAKAEAKKKEEEKAKKGIPSFFKFSFIKLRTGKRTFNAPLFEIIAGKLF